MLLNLLLLRLSVGRTSKSLHKQLDNLKRETQVLNTSLDNLARCWTKVNFLCAQIWLYKINPVDWLIGSGAISIQTPTLFIVVVYKKNSSWLNNNSYGRMKSYGENRRRTHFDLGLWQNISVSGGCDDGHRPVETRTVATDADVIWLNCATNNPKIQPNLKQMSKVNSYSAIA